MTRSPATPAQPLPEQDQRVQAVFFCSNGHDFTRVFHSQAVVPAAWECPRCSALATGTPCGELETAPPVTPGAVHWHLVRERRSSHALEEMLARAVENLRTGQTSLLQSSVVGVVPGDLCGAGDEPAILGDPGRVCSSTGLH